MSNSGSLASTCLILYELFKFALDSRKIRFFLSEIFVENLVER